MMTKRKWIIFFLIPLFALGLSCREQDNKKDLEEQDDGTLEVNATDIEGLDYRENADTLDQVQNNGGTGEGVYRQNDLPQEDIVDEDEGEEPTKEQQKTAN